MNSLTQAALRSVVERQTQNQIISGAMNRALQVVNELIAKGFTILSVRVESGKPTIEIQNCKKCKALGGAWYKRRSAPVGYIYVWQNDVCDCRVTWETQD